MASPTCSAATAAGVPGLGLYLNENADAYPTSSIKESESANSLLGLAGEPDNEVAGERDVWVGVTDPIDETKILRPGVPPVHGRQNPIRAGLNRQMEIWHHGIQVAMRCDQFVIHVARMAGRVSEPGNAGDFGPGARADGPVPKVVRLVPHRARH